MAATNPVRRYAAADQTAFPSSETQTDGMTMRQWLAGQALTGILIGDQLTGVGMPEKAEGYSRLLNPEAAAQLAFRYADAMLAEARKANTCAP